LESLPGGAANRQKKRAQPWGEKGTIGQQKKKTTNDAEKDKETDLGRVEGTKLTSVVKN